MAVVGDLRAGGIIVWQFETLDCVSSDPFAWVIGVFAGYLFERSVEEALFRFSLVGRHG